MIHSRTLKINSSLSIDGPLTSPAKTTLLVVADTLPLQLEALKAGLSHAQVGQKPYQMGYDSVYILKEVLEGNLRAVDDASNNAIYTGLDICLPENVDTCTGG